MRNDKKSKSKETGEEGGKQTPTEFSAPMSATAGLSEVKIS